MGELDGKTHGAMIARALYGMEDDEFVSIKKLGACIVATEYARGNYVSIDEEQIKKAMTAARKLLEDMSEGGLTIEAEQSNGLGRTRKGSHVAYRVFKGSNETTSFLMLNLEARRAQVKGLIANLNQSVRKALGQGTAEADKFAHMLEQTNNANVFNED